MVWVSLHSSCLGVSVLPRPGCLFSSPGLGNFQPLFLQIDFPSLSPSLLLGPLWYKCWRTWCVVPYAILILFHSFFFLIFRLGDFLYPVSLIAHPFFCVIWLSLITSSVLFISVVIYFSSDGSFFYNFYFLVDVLTQFIHFSVRFDEIK